MSKRVLITGVTGLVGRPLAAALAASGWDVHGVSRDPERAQAQVPVLAAAHPADAIGGALLSDFTAVVSLAGESVVGRWTPEKKRRIEESRVEGTRRLVDAMRDAELRPEVFVSASAIGVYGQRCEGDLTEDAPAGDDFLARVCVAWEREAERAESLGVRVVIPRIGIVLGRGGGALEAMLPPFRAGLGGKMGDGRQWMSWVHLDDLVRLIQAFLEDESFAGAYNAVSPEPVRQADFAQVLAGVLGRPSLFTIPAFALRLVFGGFSVELLTSRRVVPKRARAANFGFRHVDLEATLRDLV